MAPYPEPDARPHVLALESDREVRNLYTMLLTSEGYRVSVAPYNRQALATACARRPDVILLDFLWHDPAGSWEVVRSLRTDPVTAAIPLVVCSTAVSEASPLAAQLADLGVAVIGKPFNVATLLAVIASLITPRSERP